MEKCPVHGHIREIAEEVFVMDADFLIAGGLGPDILIAIFHFMSVGIVTAVGIDQTVVAEILIRRIVGIEIAAVGPDLFAVFAGPAHRLVNKIPYETTLI